MMNRFISVSSLLTLSLGIALLAGAGIFVARSLAQPPTSPAPGFEKLVYPEPTPGTSEANQVWNDFLAAADAGDRAGMRQHLATGSASADAMADALCNFMVEAAAAHNATARRFGKLPSESSLFFAHNDLDALPCSRGTYLTPLCTILPICSDTDVPTFIEMHPASGNWCMAVCQLPRANAAVQPVPAIVARLNHSAAVFRAATADIRAGAYSDPESAMSAIQAHLYATAQQDRY